MVVRRITMFKIPSKDDIQAVLEAYKVLRVEAKKDGKPYVVSLDAGKVYNTEEARSEGYTVVVQSTFASKEDVKYYDMQCEAHKTLKKVTTPAHKGICTLLFESDQP